MRSSSCAPEGWPSCYVAIGDSYAAGLEEDAFASWPYLLATELLGHAGPPRFLDFARSGVVTREVLELQLPRALAAEPDLVTVCCGANDVLLSVAPDIASVEASLHELLDTLRARLPEALVVTVTYGDFTRFAPFRPRSRRRVSAGLADVNRLIRELSAESGCECLDIEASPASARLDSYGTDRIHASKLGHERIADSLLGLLGSEVAA